MTSVFHLHPVKHAWFNPRADNVNQLQIVNLQIVKNT